MKKLTVTLYDYQIYGIKESIENDLNNYLERDAWTAMADIAHITTLLESLYQLGDKKRARSFRKEFKDFIKHSNNNRDEIWFAIDELKKAEFV